MNINPNNIELMISAVKEEQYPETNLTVAESAYNLADAMLKAKEA